MGLFDVLKKKQAGQGDLPPPPPPPTRGLDIDLPEAPELPPLPEIGAAPAAPEPISTMPDLNQIPPSPEPSIPTVSVEPAQDMIEERLPELQDIEEPMVMEPTVSPPRRIVEGTSIKPMFISIEDYQEILNNIGLIKDSLHDTEGAMSRLNELKNAQERVLEDWRTHIEDAERKITYIDQVIFRGE